MCCWCVVSPGQSCLVLAQSSVLVVSPPERRPVASGQPGLLGVQLSAQVEPTLAHIPQTTLRAGSIIVWSGLILYLVTDTILPSGAGGQLSHLGLD